MTPHIRGYLEEMGMRLHLDSKEKQEILHELEVHIQDRVSELVEQGISKESALRDTLESLGQSDLIEKLLIALFSKTLEKIPGTRPCTNSIWLEYTP